MDFSLQQFLIALALASLAGLSTIIGAVLAFFSRQDNLKLLSIGLGFSAGVMIYISFMEILPDAFANFAKSQGDFWGEIMGIACFFVGIFLCAFIDNLVPESLNKQNQDEFNELKFCPIDRVEHEQNMQKRASLKRTGVLTALVIAVHNFPEGFATFVAALDSLSFGVAIALAIAIHNVPEGVAVSLPIYQATGNKKKAFVYSALSGLTEPLGALVGALLLLPFMSEFVLACVFAIIAGIMVYIAFDELLPAARVYGEAHHCLYGLLAGMGVMAVSLALLGR